MGGREEEWKMDYRREAKRRREFSGRVVEVVPVKNVGCLLMTV